MAGCIVLEPRESECEKLKQQECPKGTIYTLVDCPLEYKPACIPCNSEDYIPLYCVSVEEARKLCPDRYISYGCGIGSVKDCFDGQDKSRWKKTCKDPPYVFY